MTHADTELPGIDPVAMGEWLAAQVDGVRPPFSFALVSGGRSNLTFRVTDAGGDVFALRRPPTGGVLDTAHDMSREWRFLTALAPTDVPVPRPLAYCADTAVAGAEFYVMSFVDGVVLFDRQTAEQRMAPSARGHAGEQVVDVLAALHRVDPDEVGLGGMARRGGYLQRQLSRWQRQVHRSGAPDLGLLDEVHDALVRGIPPETRGIVHGDYRPGNLSFGADGRVLAVFDWELATLGDSMADLGWLISTWEQPGDTRPPTTPGPSTAPGFPTREQLVDRYARLSGRDTSELPYYVAFARWRSACISAGVRARYQAGVMGGSSAEAENGAREVQQAEAALDAVRELGLLS